MKVFLAFLQHQKNIDTGLDFVYNVFKSTNWYKWSFAEFLSSMSERKYSKV